MKAPFLFGSRVVTERKLRQRGLHFRAVDPRESAEAYARMDPSEYARINACQEWANWRTIPRLMSLICLDPPCLIIDLGCGQGISTQILASCCPVGSRILGYDLSESAVQVASQRQYRVGEGPAIQVDFRLQSIDETWCDPRGVPLADQSVSLVNASGVVGHHLSPDQVDAVAREVQRVLTPGGWAFLDVGPRISRDQLKVIMRNKGFHFVRHVRSCWLDPHGQSAFRNASE